MSQIDILPTVLGMMGVSYESKSMGYDINRLPLGKERAFISTYQQLGYIQDNKLVILEPQKKPKTYLIRDYDNSNYMQLTDGSEKEIENKAIAWYQGASYLYKNKLLKE